MEFERLIGPDLRNISQKAEITVRSCSRKSFLMRGLRFSFVVWQSLSRCSAGNSVENLPASRSHPLKLERKGSPVGKPRSIPNLIPRFAMPTRIENVIVPQEFSAYVAEHSLVSTALYQSGVAVRNPLIDKFLAAGANDFTIPFWLDLGETDPNISSDDPTELSTPLKISAKSQIVRKSYLNQAWSEMNLASELAGSNALSQIQSRVSSYWDRVQERRLFASLLGVMYSNVAQNNGDMVNDISQSTTNSAFNGLSFIDTALTIGDRVSDLKMCAMHSKIFGEALRNNEVQFFKPSENSIEIPTYKGLGIILDDNLTIAGSAEYVTILFGPGAIGFGTSTPNTGYGTEVWRSPNAGMGGGLTELHSRVNSSLHPFGMSFTSNSVAGESPTSVELALAANWTRAVTQRKSIPLAFMVSK